MTEIPEHPAGKGVSRERRAAALGASRAAPRAAGRLDPPPPAPLPLPRPPRRRRRRPRRRGARRKPRRRRSSSPTRPTWPPPSSAQDPVVGDVDAGADAARSSSCTSAASTPPARAPPARRPLGAEIFASCLRSCHARRRQRRRSGRPLNDGDLRADRSRRSSGSSTSSTPAARLHAGEVYGDPNREGGAHIGLSVQRCGRCPRARPAARSPTPRSSPSCCHERYDLPAAPTRRRSNGPRSTTAGAARTARSTPASRTAR